MKACLSPNGSTTYGGESPVRELLVATLDGIMVLEREGPGASWQVARRTLEGVHVSALLLEPRRGLLFAGVHGSGLYRSTNGGHTWEAKTRGLTQEHTYMLSAVPRNGDVDVFVGTEPAHLFRSRDYGESWEELPALRTVPDAEKWRFPGEPHLAHVKTLDYDRRDPRTLYVGIETGALLKSSDGGQSWRELDSYSRPDDEVWKDVHRLVVDPVEPDVVWMATGVGIYRSADGGETWDRLSGGKAGTAYPDGCVLSPRDHNVVFVASSNQGPRQWRDSRHAGATVVRSRDGGRTWELLTNGLPEDRRANIEALSVYAWPGGYALFTADTDGDVHSSEDEGASWTRIASGLPPISKVQHYLALR
jgi:photosystem II stability/assembly factor-like uncharacterized protein